MKTILLFCTLIISIASSSQDKISVIVAERPSSMGVHPAFESSVTNVKAKLAEDIFKESLKKKGFLSLFKKNADSGKIGDEWVSEEFVLSEVSSSRMTVLFQVSEFGNLTYIRYFFINNGNFLGSEEYSPQREMANAEKFVYDYTLSLYEETKNSEIKLVENELSKLDKAVKKLEKKNKSYSKKIDQQINKMADSQSISQDNAISGTSANSSSIELADYEKELKKSLSEAKKQEKKVSKLEKKISQNSKKINDLEKQIGEKEDILKNIKSELEEIE